MTNLAANKPRKFQGEHRLKITYPIGANIQIFAGAALMEDGTTPFRPINCAALASAKFMGFASEWKDNRTGSKYGGTDASTSVEIETEGLVWLTMTRSTSTWLTSDQGSTVYATDSDTFAESAGTNLVPIGKIVLMPSAVVGLATGEILVKFQAASQRSI